MNEGFRANIRESMRVSAYWESRNDDHPTVVYHPGWELEVETVAWYNWGPLKVHRRAKVEHTGRLLLRARQAKWFETRSEAEISLRSATLSKGISGGSLTFDETSIIPRNQYGEFKWLELISGDIEPPSLRKAVMRGADWEMRLLL